MSWLKRRGQTTSPNPSSAPPVQMYNPNQHSNLQTHWQQQDLQAPPSNWYPQTQSSQPTFQSASYSQPPSEHNYWNRSYNPQATNTYTPNASSQYNEQYSQYNPNIYSNENNSYPQKNYVNHHPQKAGYNYSETQNHTEVTSNLNSDSWNWGWGDEDNSNVQNIQQSNTNVNTNNPERSHEETWNWTVDEGNTNSSGKIIAEPHSNSSNTTIQATTHQNLQNIAGSQTNIFPQMGKLAEKHLHSNEIYSQGTNLECNINKSPSSFPDGLALNQAAIPPTLKHNKADHLTSQWSTESQMSQDSSDLLHTSESDKSHMLSRSSTISESPVSGHDINSENVIRQELPLQQERYNVQTETSPFDNASVGYYRQDPYNLLQENKEDISCLREELKQYKTNPTPPLSKNQTPPLGPPLGGDDSSKNPYKLSSGLSHKHNSELRQSGNFPVNKTKYRITESSFNQSVNLETLPDNSEQPDSISLSYKKGAVKPALQQWPENNEVAPINDRNQYLETGQLSNNDFSQPHTTSLIDTSDSAPPPGFTRMVLGQMEQTDNLGNQDEPPPGLSRMVLGETGSSSTLSKTDSAEPLHRMIPGGSSSPKPMSRYQSTNFVVPKYGDGNMSESELNTPIPSQMRSAAIGADTPTISSITVTSPPILNRSKTIGADIAMPYSNTNLENVKANNKMLSASNNFNNNVRETNLDGANTLDEKMSQSVSTRRDSIEGEPQDTSLTSLVSSIRDLSVGENLSNGAATLAVPERSPRRPSKQESTDSDCDQDSSHLKRDRKDRRYYETQNDYDRDKSRRYSPSPDHYREKKYERNRYRDKRYDDDADYYSDKERDRKRDDKDRREELDRKYSSLKRDKEKERRRREPRGHRDYARDGHRKDYYQYEEEYDDHSRSRPSSRSDSLHDSYRQDRDRHRDRDRYRRHRDPYMPYMQGYSYDPYNPYYQQYQYHYLENLRRTNPQAYAEWYRKYYQQTTNSQQSFGHDDRASVHSGRSSANEELTKDRPFDQTDSSLCLEETTASQRLTPAKFSTAHIKASISSGRLVKIFPHYPLDGQPAIVEINNLKDILANEDEYKDLVEFPGPLIKGVTHKKTIIEYCENKIRNAIYSREIGDVDSYILMWELLILLLRQNGMVVGTDIAELLMKDRKQERSRKDSITSNSSGLIETTSTSEPNPTLDLTSSCSSILKEEVVTNKFREYLIYGSEKEALEWAMKHGLWGHALFLASKLDKRTYANVMTRFANGLTMNDPLQTLYQLLSGKLPAAVTCVSDEKWGDWRPHLAMILSNTTQRPELDRKAIMTLGDTLFNRNSLYAAQFCYLMAQVEFSRYGADSAKLVLLGSNQTKPFMEFAVNEAIYMTEVYEYACSLNDVNFVIPEFLPYKYLLATKLADRGLLEKSLAYLEKIAIAIVQNPAVAQQTLIHQVITLGDRLKYCDLIEDSFEGDVEIEDNRPDNTWLKDLRTVEKNYQMGFIPQETVENLATTAEIDQNLHGQPTYEQPWSQPYADDQQYQQHWQNMQYDQQNNVDYQQSSLGVEAYPPDQYQEQHSYWTNQQTVENVEQIGVDSGQLSDLQSQNNYWNNAPSQDIQPPQISMPNQSRESSGSLKQETSPKPIQNDSPLKHKPQDKPATTGWFGGIWNKLSLRPKNQMKLPDDKNPTIVWDEQKKRWINLDSESDAATNEIKPPPKMTDMYHTTKKGIPMVTELPTHQDPPFHNSTNVGNAVDSIRSLPEHGMIPSHSLNNNNIVNTNIQTAPQVESTATSEGQAIQSKNIQPNMFKLQRGRNIKKSYVDVFNPGSKNSGAPIASAPESFSSLPTNGLQMNYFVPAPITDPNAPTDFLTPAPIQQFDENSQH